MDIDWKAVRSSLMEQSRYYNDFAPKIDRANHEDAFQRNLTMAMIFGGLARAIEAGLPKEEG